MNLQASEGPLLISSRVVGTVKCHKRRSAPSYTGSRAAYDGHLGAEHRDEVSVLFTGTS